MLKLIPFSFSSSSFPDLSSLLSCSPFPDPELLTSPLFRFPSCLLLSGSLSGCRLPVSGSSDGGSGLSSASARVRKSILPPEPSIPSSGSTKVYLAGRESFSPLFQPITAERVSWSPHFIFAVCSRQTVRFSASIRPPCMLVVLRSRSSLKSDMNSIGDCSYWFRKMVSGSQSGPVRWSMKSCR